MNEEYRKDLKNFQQAVDKYMSWMKEEQTGLISWWLGARELYNEVTKAKLELDQWHK